MKKTLIIVGMILALSSCNYLDKVADTEYKNPPKANVADEDTDNVSCDANSEEECDNDVKIADGVASAYCTDIDGEIEVRTIPSGEVKVCKFKDGIECEENLLYEGMCPGYEQDPMGRVKSPQVIFCEKNGGNVKIFNNEIGIGTNCVFNDKSICETKDFMNRKCQKGKEFVSEDMPEVEIVPELDIPEMDTENDIIEPALGDENGTIESDLESTEEAIDVNTNSEGTGQAIDVPEGIPTDGEPKVFPGGEGNGESLPVVDVPVTGDILSEPPNTGELDSDAFVPIVPETPVVPEVPVPTDVPVVPEVTEVPAV